MDLFAHLNYSYPGTPNAARLHVSRQPQGSVQQSTQDQTYPGDGYMRSDTSGTTQACPSLNFTVGHGLRPQQKSTHTGPRGALHPDSTGPTKTYYTDESRDLSDQYIPSSSDRITCTDHRPLDEIFGNVRVSSAWSQARSASIHSSQNGIPDGHSRHTSVFTYPLPTKPQLDGVLQIPLLAVDNRMSGTGLVEFRCSDWGIGVQVEGIPMLELLHGNVSGLENPHHYVLDGLGLVDLRLNILWPHYPPFVKVISAFGTDGKPITRAEFGYEVSLAFAEFFYQITSQSIFPAQPGPYTISSSISGSPSPGIKYDHLHLIAVKNTSRGEWTPEIRAVSVS